MFRGDQGFMVDESRLEELFVKVTCRHEARWAASVQRRMETKDVLWSGTANMTAAKRREMVVIQMKCWSGESASRFLSHLATADIPKIQDDSDVREDRIEQLQTLVNEMDQAKKEWAELLLDDAKTKYCWDADVAGFLHRLQNIQSFRIILKVLSTNITASRELDVLTQESMLLIDAIRVVQNSVVLRRVSSTLLAVGNRLNAGNDKLGRADGFDIVALLEATELLQTYKGVRGATLVFYMRSYCLNDSDRQELAELIRQLPSFSPGGEGAASVGSGNLGELRTRSNNIVRALGSIEASSAAGCGVHRASANVVEQQSIVEVLQRLATKSNKLESLLDQLEDRSKDLLRYLAHKPSVDNAVLVGKQIGALADFAKKLAEEPQKPYRSSLERSSSARCLQRSNSASARKRGSVLAGR